MPLPPYTATLSAFLSIVGGGRNEQDTVINAFQSLNSVAQVQFLNLNSGDNTITVPSTAGGGTGINYCIFIPPSTNGFLLKLKGAGGDTGYNFGSANPIILPIGALLVGSTFIINAGGAVTGCQMYFI